MKVNMNSYKKLSTIFYDIDKPNAPSDALAFYLRYAKQANGPILEAMCGSGRFLLPMLEQGFHVDGVDASSNMLLACRQRAEKQKLSPVLYEQFLDKLEVPQRYQLVMIAASSICLITELGSVKESLARIYKHMLPGATFVLEIERHMPQPANIGLMKGRWVDCPDGSKIVLSWLSQYHDGERILRSINCYEWIKDGRLLETEWEDFNLRLYDPEEFSALLTSAGFTAVQTFKAYGTGRPDDSDETIVFECLKS
jgi:ubiquinone/menaquinone biosynthesis C-methylase UbiE